MHSWRRGKRKLQEKKKKNKKEITVKGLAEALADFNALFKKYENLDPKTKRFSLIVRNVHGALSVYKQIYDKIKKRTTMDIFLKSYTSSGRASGRSFRTYSWRSHCYHRRWQLHASYYPRWPFSWTRCGGGRESYWWTSTCVGLCCVFFNKRV